MIFKKIQNLAENIKVTFDTLSRKKIEVDSEILNLQLSKLLKDTDLVIPNADTPEKDNKVKKTLRSLYKQFIPDHNCFTYEQKTIMRQKFKKIVRYMAVYSYGHHRHFIKFANNFINEYRG